jgi:tripartite-type tricarboxylate transporter receptor subunit TctC
MKLPATLIVLIVALVCAPVLSRAAESYPVRPITLVVPYPPGGGVDAMGRIIAQSLSASLGQQVIIENRPGAGGVIGTRSVAKAAPDGYTLVRMIAGISLPANSGYDLSKDFAPIGLISSTPIVVIVHPSLPANLVQLRNAVWTGDPRDTRPDSDITALQRLSVSATPFRQPCRYPGYAYWASSAII